MAVDEILYPDINGHRYSYASVRFKLGGNPTPILGCTEISYKNALKPGVIRGTASRKLGRTAGTHEPEAAFSVLKLEFYKIIALLGASSSRGYCEIPFNYDFTYFDLGQPMHNDSIVGARITEIDESYSESADGLVVKCTLDVMDVLHDGLSIVSQLVPA